MKRGACASLCAVKGYKRKLLSVGMNVLVGKIPYARDFFPQYYQVVVQIVAYLLVSHLKVLLTHNEELNILGQNLHRNYFALENRISVQMDRNLECNTI